MKTISTTQKPNGKRRVVLVLDANETILVIREGTHYKLAHPVCDVMASHVIAEAEQVNWCSASQEWTA